MKELKESVLYFILSIVVVVGVLGLLFLISANALKMALGIVLSMGIIIGFCVFLRIFDKIFDYPLKSTFLDDLNNEK